MRELPLLRLSERISFKECQQRWWWGYRMGYQPLAGKPNALWFGQGVHLALAHYYQPQGKGKLRGFRRGPHPLETWEQFVKDEKPRFFRPGVPGVVPEEDFVDMDALGAAMLSGYTDYWAKEDEHWEFLIPEYAFSVIITDYDDNPLVNHVGTLDGVFRDHADEGRCKILETKTAKAISTKHLWNDPQAKDYRLVANTTLRQRGILKPREELNIIVFNFLRKALPDPRPRNAEGYCVNKDGSVSKRQPLKAYDRVPVDYTPAELRATRDHIRNEVLQMNLIRDGVVGPTKNPGFMSQNCNTCPFELPCSLHELGQDWEDHFEMFFTQQDPYADHRTGAVSSKF